MGRYVTWTPDLLRRLRAEVDAEYPQGRADWRRAIRGLTDAQMERLEQLTALETLAVSESESENLQTLVDETEEQFKARVRVRRDWEWATVRAAETVRREAAGARQEI